MAAAGLLEGSLGATAARVCQHSGVLCVGSAWHSMYVDKAGAAAAATAFGVLVLLFSMWLRGQHNLTRDMAVIGHIGRLVQQAVRGTRVQDRTQSLAISPQ